MRVKFAEKSISSLKWLFACKLITDIHEYFCEFFPKSHFSSIFSWSLIIDANLFNLIALKAFKIIQFSYTLWLWFKLHRTGRWKLKAKFVIKIPLFLFSCKISSQRLTEYRFASYLYHYNLSWTWVTIS